MLRVKLLIFILSLVLLIPQVFAGFEELKGEHFIVYYQKDYKSFAKDILSYAEQHYVEIAEDLGYSRYSKFWLWDKRVKIYIYPDHNSYLKASGMQDWSHGMATYDDKVIMSYVRGEGFMESILPHEIAHLMFRDFVGFKGEIPLWLDEGVAQWAEKNKRKQIKQLMKQAFDKREFFSIQDMMKIDLKEVSAKNKIYIYYTTHKEEPVMLLISGGNLVDLYYLEAVSLVGFMIERHGGKSFTDFCRALRDGKTIDQALKKAYPHTIKDRVSLEAGWRQYVEEQ
jgi:hypothetical protein